MNTTAPRTPSPSRLLEHATTAAHAAAEYLRSLDREGLSREYKASNHDIVTEHDRRSEEIIVSELRRLVPGARIVGEEGGERPAEQPDSGADGPVVSFYVDPIDGTSNFAAGLPLFCISIGVAVGDELVAGVIDAPILGQVFAAADGPATLDGRVLAPRSTRPAPDALVLSGYPGQRRCPLPEHAAHATRTRGPAPRCAISARPRSSSPTSPPAGRMRPRSAPSTPGTSPRASTSSAGPAGRCAPGRGRGTRRVPITSSPPTRRARARSGSRCSTRSRTSCRSFARRAEHPLCDLRQEAAPDATAPGRRC